MSTAVDLKTKEEKDAELDRRIEALRKKNEALVKRYQEIEEDKKKAEQEGIAVTTARKPRPHEPETDRRKTEKENFTVTVDLSKLPGENRVINDWKPGTPRGRKTSEETDGHGGQNDGHKGQSDDQSDGHRGQSDQSDGHRGQSDGHRGQSDGHRDQSDVHRGQSDGHSSPTRRTGSGRMGRGGQRGGRQERREWEPRTPRDGEPGESGGGGQRRRGGGREWEPRTPRDREPRESGGGGQGRRGGGREWEPRTPRDGEPGESGGGGQGRRGGGREWEPRTPRDGEPGESGGGGQGRRGGRRGRGERGGGGGGSGGGEEGEGGTTGGVDRKSKEWDEKRRQNIEKMNEEMEKIAEYERGQRQDGDKPIRNFLDDPRRSGPAPDIDRKEGSRRHVRNWGGLDFDNVKTGSELEKEWTSRRPGPKGSMDMTIAMTGRERAEYLRWKKEREQIDEERLARHRNATGQWRREWDAQKTENMFKEDPCAATEGITPEQGGRRDDSKRPPKVPTFGDFLSQGRSQGPRGDRGRGRGRGQKPSYSMHDNRWEAEKEEEDNKGKEDKTKKEEKPKKEEKEEEKAKSPTTEKVEEKNKDGEEDEEEWEDASDGEDDDEAGEDESDSDQDSRGDEKKDKGKEKPTRSKGSNPTSPAHRSRTTSAGSPKEQRTPRPKIHIPSPSAVQESPEGGKPLSPFLPLESHQPVSDWGEEMEMLSPRSSMGGESPLKPLSVESTPPQKKDQEEEEESQAACSNEPAEPQREKDTAVDVISPSEAQQTVIVSEPESVPADSSAALPSDPAPSEVSEAAVMMDAPAAQSQDKPDTPPPASVLDADQISSEQAGEKDDGAATAEINDAP
ncbi:coiled-coil domain-containing protein 9, partial [Tautogolabrus adspersus]